MYLNIANSSFVLVVRYFNQFSEQVVYKMTKAAKVKSNSLLLQVYTQTQTISLCNSLNDVTKNRSKPGFQCMVTPGNLTIIYVTRCN